MPTHPRAASFFENDGSLAPFIPRPGSIDPRGSSSARNWRTSAWSARSDGVNSVARNRIIDMTLSSSHVRVDQDLDVSVAVVQQLLQAEGDDVVERDVVGDHGGGVD